MRPDIKRERRSGWLVLGAAGVLSLSVVGWYANDGGLQAHLDAARTDHRLLVGKEPMALHLQRQEQANHILSETIEDLKKGSGFTMAPFFSILPEDRINKLPDPTIWNHKCDAVREIFSTRAHDLGVKNWDVQNLGFATNLLPSDSEVPYYFTVLQLTYRAASICFSPPPKGFSQLKEITISHEQRPPRATAPPGRPGLLFEYPLTITVRASLTEVMWILYQFSLNTPDPANIPLDPGAYPLVLEDLHIKGSLQDEPPTPVLDVVDVTATFKVAGLQFIAAAKRGDAPAAAAGRPTTPQSHPTTGPAPSGSGVFQGRP